jgi:hypothetical protein
MLLKQRLHLFEFGDQPWLKGWFRETYLECLNLNFRMGGHYKKMDLPFLSWLNLGRGNEVHDFASGGALPIETILTSLKERGEKVPRVTLSDLFPDIEKYKKLKDQLGSDVVNFLEEPVSLMEMEKYPSQFKSICSALHHFSKEDARKIINGALNSGRGLFIMEPFQRSMGHLLMVAVFGLIPAMLSPFLGTFSFKKLFFCTILPVIPLMLYVDGIVSVLRTYSFEELQSLIPEAHLKNFSLHYGKQPYFLNCSSTYFYLAKKE